MDKLKMQSANGVQDNILKIAQLFPNCVTETSDENTGRPMKKLDFEKLKQELSDVLISDREERYQFTWPDKRKAILAANAPVNATLRPCREESVNFDTTQNLYIEGDNLDVLKCLKETYLHKVKMIYIDPPYNTGNDFVYEDDFAESAAEYLANSGQFDEQGNRMVTNTESNGRFHTDWLNMIYPRLKVARDLLTKDGVIFISIDENEITNLKHICNEVFGEANLVTVIHCQMSTTQGMKVKAAQIGNIVKNAEYIIVYSIDGHKNIAQETPLYDLRPEYDEHYTLYLNKDGSIGQLSDVYNYKFPKDCANKKPMKVAEAFRKSEEFADIVRSHLADIVRSHLADIVCSDKVTGFDITSELKNGYWKEVERNGKKYLLTLDKNGSVRQLLRLSDSWGKCDDYYRSEGLRKIRGDWWANFYIDMGNVSKEGDMEFNNGKKPVRLINQLAKMCCPSNSLILDFFSGSATTAHAVMQLNAEDGGNRKFIMVQLPELTDEKSEAYKAGYKNICEIGKERIRRAGNKILELSLENLEKEGVIERYARELSEVRSLEEVYGCSGISLLTGQEAAKGGDICIVRPNAEGGSVDTIEHSGGTVQREQGVCAISENSEGFARRVGDAVIDLRTLELLNQRGYKVVLVPSRRNQQNDLFADQTPTNEDISSKLSVLKSKLSVLSTDTGFRVLKLDSTNMEDIYYSPAATDQRNLFNMVDNVKPDRTSEDLLFQVMLELGATLDSKIEETTVSGKTIYNVADNSLVACFDQNVTDEVVTAIAKMQPMYAVLRDTSMKTDSTATNFEQIFKTYSPNTVTKIL